MDLKDELKKTVALTAISKTANIASSYVLDKEIKFEAPSDKKLILATAATVGGVIGGVYSTSNFAKNASKIVRGIGLNTLVNSVMDLGLSKLKS